MYAEDPSIPTDPRDPTVVPPGEEYLLDGLFDELPDTLPEALVELQLTLAMITNRLDAMDRTLSAIMVEQRYFTQWIDRNEHIHD